MLVNVYMYYIAVNLAAGLKYKDLLSHHDIRKAVALSWINEPLYWTPKKKPASEDQQQYKGPSMTKKKKTPVGSATRSKKWMATDSVSCEVMPERRENKASKVHGCWNVSAWELWEYEAE
jgi:hypothetical protein